MVFRYVIRTNLADIDFKFARLFYKFLKYI